MPTPTVIVPLASERDAERLLPVAQTITDALGATMKISRVVTDLESPRTEEHRTWIEPLATEYGAEMLLVESDTVASGLRFLLSEHPGATVCMTVDATGGRVDAWLGSIVMDVVGTGHESFFLVGPSVPSTHDVRRGPVVICVDGSDLSESMLPEAAAWAATTTSVVWLVQVVTGAKPDVEIPEAAYVHRLAGSIDVDDVQWEVLHGPDPADAIVAFADRLGASCVAMATHGRGGLSRIAVGSVATRVAHRAHCPVLVRRPPSPS
ncbi:universal stress protein [Actinospongicola halichondriae]|uniref:universal stress protein n=1 Tax=Actinospongicola halichondriae TaxID=3236844 RepID=UPI003D48976A